MEPVPPCCPDFPNCKHAPQIPNVMPIATKMNTGSAILPDGSPVVVITDMIQGQAATLTPLEAKKLGVRLLGLAERAVANALLYQSMIANGTDPLEAHRFVEAFKNEHNRVLRGEKIAFQPPSAE